MPLATNAQRSAIDLTIVPLGDVGSWAVWKNAQMLEDSFASREIANAYCRGYAEGSTLLVRIYG